MKIAIIGTGEIGSAVTKKLLEVYKEIIIYNRTVEKMEPLIKLGAVAKQSIKEAIEDADVIILGTYGGNVIKEVLLNDEIKETIKGKKILTIGTSEAEEIIAISKEVESVGGQLSELAIMSGTTEVINGESYALLGSTKELENFWIELLKPMGIVTYVGEVGSPSLAVIPSILGAGLMSAYMAYTVSFAIKMNLPQEVIARDLGMFMPGIESMIPSLLNREYKEGAATVEGYKHTIEMAKNAIEKAGLPIDVFNDIISLYDKAIELGFKDKPESALIEGVLGS